MIDQTDVTLEDADVAHLAHVLDLVYQLARLHVAREQAAKAPEGVEVADVEVLNPARFIIDEASDMIALGLVQRDGTVRPLAGWHLSAVQARLRQAHDGSAGDAPSTH